MAILIDTSLWIAIYRDQTGTLGSAVEVATRGERPLFARAIAAEILQGCADETEWRLVSEHLAEQTYIEMHAGTWTEAARIYFDLRRAGSTVRSTLDCCIAQLAMENDAELFHCDRDFERIAKARPLKQLFIAVAPG